VVTLAIEIRFSHRVPEHLPLLRRDMQNLTRHNATVSFEVQDGPHVQRAIYDWTQQTCLVEGDVQGIRVTRVGP
jgi:hypothetical protein